jgi:predicted kinase
MDDFPAVSTRGGRSVSVTLRIPGDALVLLVGVAGSGKSTFARHHFAATEILSSDALRAVITDDEAGQGATDDAFDLLHRILAMRLLRGRLTVVDATNVEEWARAELIAVARRHRRPAVAIVLDLPLSVALERNAARPAPRPPPAALRRQHRWLSDSLPSLEDEGFAAIHRLGSVDEVDGALIERSGHTKRPEGTGARPR